jgi:hypothetical protein
MALIDIKIIHSPASCPFYESHANTSFEDTGNLQNTKNSKIFDVHSKRQAEKDENK